MPFVFSKPVTGKDYVGRHQEVADLSNLLSQGENVVIYDIPGSGKSSVIQQTFHNMRVSSQSFSTVEFSLHNCRTVADFMMRFGSAVLGVFCSTPSAYLAAIGKFLEGTHFVFNHDLYSMKGQVLSLESDIDDDDIKAVLSLPYRLALDNLNRLYVILEDFQNVMLTEDGNKVCRILNSLFDTADSSWKEWCSFILCGNMVNAMKGIFGGGLLFRNVKRLELKPVSRNDMADYVIKIYNETGKVIDRGILLDSLALMKDNPSYAMHFFSICDSMSRGFITEPVLNDALHTLLFLHSVRFKAIMNDLTTFQVCFLRAVIDGNRKFTSLEVIRKYNLSSAANVRRLREALCKKEIITLNEDDEPELLDPLFEYWVRKYFFEIN